MTQQNILELAKQGHPRAIESLINRQMQPKGITAKVALKNNCLNIMLEAAQPPDQKALVPVIRKGITNLGVTSIEILKIYGKQAGEQVPAWSQEFELPAQNNSFTSAVNSSPTVSNNQLQKVNSSVVSEETGIVQQPKNFTSAPKSSQSGFSLSPDAADPILLLIGCFIVGLIFAAINPVTLIMTAVLGLIPAKIASDKGRKFFSWWCYGFMLFIFAIIHAVVLKEDEETLVTKGTMKKCPYCAEIIKYEAKVCRYCGRELSNS